MVRQASAKRSAMGKSRARQRRSNLAVGQRLGRQPLQRQRTRNDGRRDLPTGSQPLRLPRPGRQRLGLGGRLVRRRLLCAQSGYRPSGAGDRRRPRVARRLVGQLRRRVRPFCRPRQVRAGRARQRRRVPARRSPGAGGAGTGGTAVRDGRRSGCVQDDSGDRPVLIRRIGGTARRAPLAARLFARCCFR